MKDTQYDMSTSEFLFADDESLSLAVFTDVEIVHEGRINVLAKAKRYGKWWMLKGLKPELRDSLTHLSMLRKEFDILISMQHPNVVGGVGVEEIEELGLCVVMEWVDGLTLKQWLAKRPKHKERMRVVLQLMDALEYVHGKQAAHRDLKPSNILITRNGNHVKLIDFGLSDTDDSVIYKQPAGSAGYISPEQAVSRISDIRNDIFSLGCVMEDMKLGVVYSPLIVKCKSSADSRYRHVASLRRDFLRVTHLPHYIAAAVLFVGMLASWRIIYTLRADFDTANTQLEQLTDRNPLIRTAVEDGKRWVEVLVEAMENDTTCTDEQRMEIYRQVTVDAASFLDRFTAVLQPQLTEAETKEVRQILDKYYEERLKALLPK